ncbi:hypothetical protein C8Q72DRAFT_815863 [Fomitopsis betulina]|nr:hypothetical protein C8Q72DRAFT_815863 [Fomitopsis betulina]
MMPAALEHNGEYVVPWARTKDRARLEAYDGQVCARLWGWLELKELRRRTQAS